MDRLLDEMITYALDFSYDDIPQDVIVRAKHLILDTVGCALGASPSTPATIAQAIAGQISSDTPASVMVGGQKTSPDLAAFANGVMIRYLDYNDMYNNIGGCHPSDMLAPVLAAVDAVHGDGRAAILGMVLGYEIFCSVADGSATREARGWDQATTGVVGAAVVAARLLGLSKEQMGHAVSLAVSSHLSVGQIRAGQISHWKGCAVANASRNALFCAMLAAKGMTGPNYVFEGPSGYFNATGGPFTIDLADGSNSPFKIMSACIKPFPSGYFSQSAIEAVQELRPMVSSIDDVKELRLNTFPHGYNAMGSDESRWKPETRETADHSLPFVMAVTLMDGRVEVRHYDEEYFKKPDVRALMAKIKVRIGEESVQAWPDVPLNVVECEMNNGELHTTRVSQHLGHFQRLMTDADQDRKFRPLAEEYAGLPGEQVDRLLDRLRNLEQVQDIGEMLALTVTR